MRKTLESLVVLAVLMSLGTDSSADDKALMDRLAKAVTAHVTGFESVGQATIAHLNKKGSKTFEEQLEGGYCYRFIAVGEKDGFKLDMRVSSGQDILGESASPAPVVLVDACTGSSSTMDVRVGTVAFGGDFIFAVYRVKAAKAPGKSEIGARMAVLAQKNVPGAKLVSVPTTSVLAKGKSYTLAVPVKGGTCYKFIAVGGGGVDDVGLVVKSKAQVVSQDSTSGDHPIVEYCPTKAGQLVMQVTATKGQGAILASAFEAPASSILVGVSDAQTALDLRLKSEAEIYAPDMNMVGVVLKGEILNKKPIYHDVLLAKGVCYKFIAVGGAGIDDLDIDLVKSKGKSKKGALASDTTDDDAPIASYCADASGSAVIRLGSVGSGMYSMAIFAGASGESGATSGYAELTSALATEAKKLDEQYEPADSIKTAVIGEGTDASFSVKMQSDLCYGLLVVGLGDIKALSMEVTGEGNKLGSGTKVSSTLFVELCPGKDVVASVKVGAPSGYGAVAFEAWSRSSGVDQVFIPIGGLKNTYISKAIRKMHEKQGKKRPAVTDLLQAELQTAKVKTFDVELQGGKCYTVLAAGNPSVKELQIKLMSPLGEEVASAKDQGAQVVVHTTPCPQWNGTYKLEVKMFMGYGEFGAQIFGE